MSRVRKTLFLPGFLLGALAAGWLSPNQGASAMNYDLLLRHGTIYDGSGHAPFVVFEITVYVEPDAGSCAVRNDTPAS